MVENNSLSNLAKASLAASSQERTSSVSLGSMGECLRTPPQTSVNRLMSPFPAALYVCN